MRQTRKKGQRAVLDAWMERERLACRIVVSMYLGEASKQRRVNRAGQQAQQNRIGEVVEGLAGRNTDIGVRVMGQDEKPMDEISGFQRECSARGYPAHFQWRFRMGVFRGLWGECELNLFFSAFSHKCPRGRRRTDPWGSFGEAETELEEELALSPAMRERGF